MKQVSVAIINKSAPFGSMAGKEAQDLALIFGSYEQEVAIYFIGDGVYHLIQQQAELIGAKDYLKTYEAFSFYDIEHLYVCENSLNERNIEPSALLDIATVITSEQMSLKLAEHHAVYTF